MLSECAVRFSGTMRLGRIVRVLVGAAAALKPDWVLPDHWFRRSGKENGAGRDADPVSPTSCYLRQVSPLTLNATIPKVFRRYRSTRFTWGQVGGFGCEFGPESFSVRPKRAFSWRENENAAIWWGVWRQLPRGRRRLVRPKSERAHRRRTGDGRTEAEFEAAITERKAADRRDLRIPRDRFFNSCVSDHRSSLKSQSPGR